MSFHSSFLWRGFPKSLLKLIPALVLEGWVFNRRCVAWRKCQWMGCGLEKSGRPQEWQTQLGTWSRTHWLHTVWASFPMCRGKDHQTNREKYKDFVNLLFTNIYNIRGLFWFFLLLSTEIFAVSFSTIDIRWRKRKLLYPGSTFSF